MKPKPKIYQVNSHPPLNLATNENGSWTESALLGNVENYRVTIERGKNVLYTTKDNESNLTVRLGWRHLNYTCSDLVINSSYVAAGPEFPLLESLGSAQVGLNFTRLEFPQIS